MTTDHMPVNPEQLFTEAYWGEELAPPLEQHEVTLAKSGDRKSAERLLGNIIIPILRGEIRGPVLPEGSSYNPNDPNLSGLVQHLQGTVTLVDYEMIRNSSDPPSELAKTLPLEESDEDRLNMASREFVLSTSRTRLVFPRASLQISHNDMAYWRVVTFETILMQRNGSGTIAYGPTTGPVLEGRRRPIWEYGATRETERIGAGYQRAGGGIARTTRVEICQEGAPSKIPERSTAKMGKLATNS